MKYLTIIMTLLALTACGDDAFSNQDGDTNKIQGCVAQGGHPLFTWNSDGTPFFIDCERPKP